MQQFDVKRGSRKCCVTEQLFGPGDIFYSALIETSSGTVRNDYSCDAWDVSLWSETTETPTLSAEQTEKTSEETIHAVDLQDGSLIGWWRQRVPELDSGKVYWAPDHVLIAWFESLYSRNSEDDTCRNETAWVMALLLMQKRILAQQDHDADADVLHLVNKKTNQQYTLHEPEIDTDRINAIQNQLEEQLFSDLPITN